MVSHPPNSARSKLAIQTSQLNRRLEGHRSAARPVYLVYPDLYLRHFELGRVLEYNAVSMHRKDQPDKTTVFHEYHRQIPVRKVSCKRLAGHRLLDSTVFRKK
jgi:hypothetical protein